MRVKLVGGRLAFSLLAPCLAMAQSPGTFTVTGSMTTPRAGHTATLLPNGKVLIAGGPSSYAGHPVASAELYDPSTDTFTPTGNMTTARRGHTATLLANGQVLIAGGSQDFSAELYDPSTGMFTPTGSMATAGPATLLADGRVFVAGTANAEIYDPATGTFTLTGPYADPTPVYCCTVTTLADGRVLLTGCAAAELFDPGTGAFRVTGSPSLIWSGDCDGVGVMWTATLLMNGTVLLVESGVYDVGSVYRDLAEVYDPATETFTTVGSLQDPQVYSATVSLADGTVLITGGELIGGSSTPGSDLYLPATGAFASAGNMTTGRWAHTATLLPDGTVLIAGGASGEGYPHCCSLTASAEIYAPSVRVAPPVLFSTSGDGQGQGAILHANTSRVASSGDPAAVGEYLEIYLTGLAEGSVIPPQVSIGGWIAGESYFGPSGSPGVNQINVRVPSGVAPGTAVPVWLTYMGRPSNQVTIGVQ